MRRAFLNAAVLLICAGAAGTQVPQLAAFSSGGGQLPAGWKPLEFPKIPSHTSYSFVQDTGTWVLRAESHDAASGLTQDTAFDLHSAPILRWRWKVENVLQKASIERKDGDDYAARVYVLFKYEPQRVGFFRKSKYLLARAIYGDVPIASLIYVWASNADRGKVFDNPYTGDFVKMMVVENGKDGVGSWRSEQRDVLADFRAAYGEDPPEVQGVALMTDTDDTNGSAVAYYGDISFGGKP